MAKQPNKLRHILDTVLVIKRIAIIAAIGFVAFILYRLLINTVLDRSIVFGIIALWAFSAYIVLPRIHRLLTKIYIPDYFIGRTRTSDGLLGDPVNLALHGSKKDIKLAMKQAGWIEADELNTTSTWKMISASVRRKSYPNAPVSSLYLLGNKQDLAFQQEVNGSTKSRHHVRFWKVPNGWYLPGGYTCDYLGAATFDTSVGVSLYTFQVTHRIEEDTDIERDYVLKSLTDSNKKISVDIVENFTTGYHSRNGGGDTIKTDGSLPFIHL